METTIIDFKEVIYQDLEGTELALPDQWIKGFGNTIYIGGTIPMSELGSKIYHSYTTERIAELNSDELELLIQAIEITKMLGTPAHNALKAYLTNKLQTLNK
ncbi:hypothetical protein [Pedobacter cryoconitis]|uniref:Uncharacterized protein n=1 Tax=Pedobacter cryoconitis TaxID=188932 RepID=A0A327T5N8_9SPHI|nr:hypothetical protein [Pedobacter cryoconitis]RAJ35384.1 hypothetical protein LY11_00627 [Pedobacter cryoconitis]